jgi:Fe-S-cluster containining protein
VTDCARCGQCCDPVKVPYGAWAEAVATARGRQPEQLDLADAHTARYWADAVFLAGHCRPAGGRNGFILLTCAHYDPGHRSCTAYDARPPVCRGFPWYDDPQTRAADIAELCCSYLLDVPPADRPEGARPLIPITPV